MDILLTASNTIFNKIVRKKTNSQWGHLSVVIDDVVYDFDYNNKAKLSLSSILSDTSITKATLFHVDILGGDKDAEELYKNLFDKSNYDTKSLHKIIRKIEDGRDLENIQSETGLYTCSGIIAKAYSRYEKLGLVPELLRDIHWSQSIPNDYSNFDFKKEYKR